MGCLKGGEGKKEGRHYEEVSASPPCSVSEEKGPLRKKGTFVKSGTRSRGRCL